MIMIIIFIGMMRQKMAAVKFFMDKAGRPGRIEESVIRFLFSDKALVSIPYIF